MKSKIIFVGGIHGVGKSTLCKYVSIEHHIGYLSASDVIRQYKQLIIQDKFIHAADMDSNQDLLLKGLDKLELKEEHFLLDGHFSLLTKEKTIETIPLITFKKLQPIRIIVVVCEVQKIALRLYNRDGIKYSLDTLQRLQDRELQHAKYVSRELAIPLYQINTEDSHLFSEKIEELKQK